MSLDNLPLGWEAIAVFVIVAFAAFVGLTYLLVVLLRKPLRPRIEKLDRRMNDRR